MNNPLLEHANLFVNGQFGIQIDAYGEQYIEKPLIGYKAGTLFTDSKLGLGIWDIHKCTLIARSIEDMDRKECAIWGDTSIELLTINEDFDYIKDGVIKQINNDSLKPSDLLWLLERGFYPFGQEAFKTGTVIDSATL